MRTSRLKQEDAEILALQLRFKLGMSESEPLHMKTVLQSLQVMVMYRPMSETAYGMSLRSKSGKCFMLINSACTRGRQHYTIAHELYHLFFEEHPEPHLFREDEEVNNSERDANMFAGVLLMPREGLIRMLSVEQVRSHTIDIATVLRMEQYFAVSRNALLIRLRQLGLITDENMESLKQLPVMKTARQFGYDTSLYEPGNNNYLSGDYGELANRLFDEEKISEGHYMELMNVLGYASEN